MKSMLKKHMPYLLAFPVLLNSGCGDTFEQEGIMTTVYGKAYDWQNRLPVAGQLLIVVESNKKPIAAPPGSKLTNMQHLDSAYTDEDGKYEITFVTTGRGDTYHILPARSDSV
jgi:hypothetical protein